MRGRRRPRDGRAATASSPRASSSSWPGIRLPARRRRRAVRSTTSTSPPRRSSAASSSTATASAGPRRAARRSERYASLIRIDTINGQPATEVVDGARYDDLPAAFPSVRIPPRHRGPDAARDRIADAVRPRLARDDHRRGSRRESHSCCARSPAVAGSTGRDAAGAPRPRRRAPGGDHRSGAPARTRRLPRSASRHRPTRRTRRWSSSIDQAKRIAARGGHVIVSSTRLDAVHAHTARKALAAARQIVDGGS